MGVGSKLIPRQHKLRNNVEDKVYRKIGNKYSPVKSAADSPGNYNFQRGSARRRDNYFGEDVLNRAKRDLCWYRTVGIARFDFGGGVYGIKITFPATTQTSYQGLQAGDEIKILGKKSVLSGKRYAVITDTANVTNVSAGYARKVSATVVRLPDIGGFVTEASTRIKVTIGTGVRIKSYKRNVEGLKLENNAVFIRDTIGKAVV